MRIEPASKSSVADLARMATRLYMGVRVSGQVFLARKALPTATGLALITLTRRRHLGRNPHGLCIVVLFSA